MGTLILTKTKKNMNAIQTIVILLLAASISCQSALEAHKAEIAAAKVQQVAKEQPDSLTARQLVIIGDANVQEPVNAEKDSYSKLREAETAERMLDDDTSEEAVAVMTWEDLLTDIEDVEKLRKTHFGAFKNPSVVQPLISTR